LGIESLVRSDGRELQQFELFEEMTTGGRSAGRDEKSLKFRGIKAEMA
jgi:hypothetical protein